MDDFLKTRLDSSEKSVDIPDEYVLEKKKLRQSYNIPSSPKEADAPKTASNRDKASSNTPRNRQKVPGQLKRGHEMWDVLDELEDRPPLEVLSSIKVELLQTYFKKGRESRRNLPGTVSSSIPTEEDERSLLAAEFVRNAIERRSPRLELSHRTEKLVESIVSSSIYRFLIITIIIIHCFIVVFEPSTTGSRKSNEDLERQPFYILLSIELVFVLLYAADASLEIFAIGFKRFQEKRWNLGYILVIFVSFIEIITAMISSNFISVRWSRPLRAILLISKSRRIRRIATQILKSIPYTIGVCSSLLIFSSAFAVVGTAVLSGDYSETLNPFPKTQNFNTFGIALLSMFVLTTTESYPDVLHIGYDNHPIFSLFFFLVFVVFGSWLFLSLVLAVIFQFYKAQQKDKVSRERVKEQENLLLAFRILDTKGTGELDFPPFYRMIRHIRRNITEGEARIIFYVMNQDESSSINILEFMGLTEILSYDISLVDSGYWTVSGGFIQKVSDMFTLPSPPLQELVYSSFFRVFSISTALLNAFVIITYDSNLNSSEKRISDAFNGIFLSLFLFQVLLGIFSDGWKAYIEKKSGTLVILIVSLIVEISIPSSQFYILQCFRSLRVLRLCLMFEQLHIFVRTLTEAQDIMLDLFGLTVVVMYIFAVIGMELFSTVSLGRELGDKTPENFDTFPKAMLALFQIATINNWHDVMYSALEQTNVYYCFYFLVFFFIVCMVILNIFSALIIRAYAFILHQGDMRKVQVFSLPLEGPSGSSVELWRVKAQSHYSRSLLSDVLPVFNAKEMKELKRKIFNINAKLKEKIGTRTLSRAGLSSRQLIQLKLFGEEHGSLSDLPSSKTIPVSHRKKKELLRAQIRPKWGLSEESTDGI